MLQRKYFITYLIFLLGIGLPGCVNQENYTPLNLTGEWEFIGLDTSWVYTVKVYNNQLYSGSNSGVHRRGEQGLQPLGLQDRTVLDIEQVAGHDFFALVVQDHTDRRSIFRTTDNGATWFANMGNYGGEDEHTAAIDMSIFIDAPNHLMVKGSGYIAKSLDSGTTWEPVFLEWNTYIGFSNFIEINPYNNNIVWGGGADGLFMPRVQKTTDKGKNWELISVFPDFTRATVSDVVFNKKSNNKVLLAMGGVMYSSNGGASWQRRTTEHAITEFTVSQMNEDIIFGAGFNHEQQLAFSVSQNFGKTWESIHYPQSPGGIFVNDVTSTIEDGKEVLYFATNKGIYKYTIDSEL